MNLVTAKGLIKVETEETRRLFHWYLELKFELLNDTYYSENIISIFDFIILLAIEIKILNKVSKK